MMKKFFSKLGLLKDEQVTNHVFRWNFVKILWNL